MDDLIEFTRAAARFAYGERARLSFEEQSGAYPDEKRWRLIVKDRGEVVADAYGASLEESARRFAKDRAAHSRETMHAHRGIDRAAAILGL